MTNLIAHRLDAPGATLVLGRTDGPPAIVYFGAPLRPETDLVMLVASRIQPLGKGTLDVLPGVALLPEAARGFTGYPGLIAHRPDAGGGAWEGRFAFRDAARCDDTNSLAITCADADRGFDITFHCRLCPESSVAVFKTELTNSGSDDAIIDWLSAPVINVPPMLTEQLRFSGRWCAEFEIHRRPIPLGISSTENRRGRTSHEAFPGVICTSEGATENTGTCLGLHLGWSGNHRLLLERKSHGLTQAQLGVLPLAGEMRLKPGAALATPELYAATSDRGLNGVSQAFHAFVRTNIAPFPEPAAPRPVTVNTWEAIYFDHTLERLTSLADAAADIGAERFVLDDGWFKNRTDDTRALGDWVPDARKYPDGLHPLVDYVVDRKGMQFGLWVEPEMVNEDSDLFRAHPDWALTLS
ncbi:MAG: alpha-galactosidase, partial [Pseudomonadota bacterium]